jgi:hypothetical protein
LRDQIAMQSRDHHIDVALRDLLAPVREQSHPQAGTVSAAVILRNSTGDSHHSLVLLA